MNVKHDESTDQLSALRISPEFSALRVILAADQSKTLDEYSLTAVMRQHSSAVIDGDLRRLEAMLSSQATALQTLFARLTERAMAQTSIDYYATHMKLALKAQAQCRATLESLALIKNPPHVVMARQANISNGPQQVNNGLKDLPRAREIKSEQNQLLEIDNGKRLDTRATSATSSSDPSMATVGKVDRPANRGRKSRIC